MFALYRMKSLSSQVAFSIFTLVFVPDPFVCSRNSRLISVEISNRLAVIGAVTLPKEVESVPKEKESTEGG
jgi:hypothetical protein